MISGNVRPVSNSSRREMGKVGMQQHNKDRLGATSGSMGAEDRRKDKYGSVHNQDRKGLRSPETQEVREALASVRRKLKGRKRLGSRG